MCRCAIRAAVEAHGVSLTRAQAVAGENPVAVSIAAHSAVAADLAGDIRLEILRVAVAGMPPADDDDLPVADEIALGRPPNLRLESRRLHDQRVFRRYRFSVQEGRPLEELGTIASLVANWGFDVA